MFRLRSLHHRGLLVGRRSTISTLRSLTSSRRPTHVCLYIYAVHSRLVQVRLAFTLCWQNCVNGWYLETSSLELLLPLPDFIHTVLT